MSSVYVLINLGWDEKDTITRPDIYGPFGTESDAERFIELHPNWNGIVLEPSDGGYAAAHIVSRETATDPAVAFAEWKERLDELEAEERADEDVTVS